MRGGGGAPAEAEPGGLIGGGPWGGLGIPGGRGGACNSTGRVKKIPQTIIPVATTVSRH